jgi:CheY-specific phosphatase CheX
MESRLRAPFVGAIQHVFDTLFQMGVETEVRGPVSPFRDEPRVSGLLTLAGDVEGVVLLSAPLPTAERLACLFLGRDDPPEDHDQLRDAVGEILSMIAGAAAAELDPELRLEIGCHSVAVGSGPRKFRSTDRTLSIPCATELGELMLDIAVDEVSAGSLSRAETHASLRP